MPVFLISFSEIQEYNFLTAAADDAVYAAKEMAKELYTNTGYKGNIHATYVKAVVEGETGAFDVVYTPSKSAKLGTYLAFGVEA